MGSYLTWHAWRQKPEPMHCVRELLYADDMALVATDYNEIQEILSQFHSAVTMFGLKINTKIKKTELMYQPHPTNSLHLRNTGMLINGEALRCTDSFTYLGSTVTNTNSSDLEIERHVQSASKTFGTLQNCPWSHHNVKLCTKIKVYNTAILPILLYSTETMTLYGCHLRCDMYCDI